MRRKLGPRGAKRLRGGSIDRIDRTEAQSLSSAMRGLGMSSAWKRFTVTRTSVIQKTMLKMKVERVQGMSAVPSWIGVAARVNTRFCRPRTPERPPLYACAALTVAPFLLPKTSVVGVEDVAYTAVAVVVRSIGGECPVYFTSRKCTTLIWASNQFSGHMLGTSCVRYLVSNFVRGVAMEGCPRPLRRERDLAW